MGSYVISHLEKIIELGYIFNIFLLYLHYRNKDKYINPKTLNTMLDTLREAHDLSHKLASKLEELKEYGGDNAIDEEDLEDLHEMADCIQASLYDNLERIMVEVHG